MRLSTIRILVFAAILLAAVAVSAQNEDAIVVTTEIVNVSVSVTDKQGEPVRNLTQEDFELYDNDRQTDIAFFSNREAPISFGIVYDLHPTTADESKSVLGSLKVFTDSLDPSEDFFLTIFNEYGSLNVNFVPSPEQIARHLSFGERNEPNSLYDVVFLAGQKLKKRPNQKKTLIIISDGKDQQSHHSFKQLERLFASFSVQIHAVILNRQNVWGYDELGLQDEPSRLGIDESKLDKAAIKVLSEGSGGVASESQLKNSIELLNIFGQIIREMRGRYALGFYPVDADYHKLRIRLKSNDRKEFKLNYRSSIRLKRSEQNRQE